jgi:hypothetical protein
VKKLSINYEKTDTGGSCAPTCHVSLKYDRYSPHDVMMIVSPRLGEDATEQELQESMNRDMPQNEQNEQAEADDKDEGKQNEQAEADDKDEGKQNE